MQRVVLGYTASLGAHHIGRRPHLHSRAHAPCRSLRPAARATCGSPLVFYHGRSHWERLSLLAEQPVDSADFKTIKLYHRHYASYGRWVTPFGGVRPFGIADNTNLIFYDQESAPPRVAVCSACRVARGVVQWSMEQWWSPQLGGHRRMASTQQQLLLLLQSHSAESPSRSADGKYAAAAAAAAAAESLSRVTLTIAYAPRTSPPLTARPCALLSIRARRRTTSARLASNSSSIRTRPPVSSHAHPPMACGL